jgi:DNA-binding response OmpR family regulator
MVKGCYMPVKILLADKSITIQKVVEMLFSGKEYVVSCASDGETALNEAGRALPDVVLADVDLPRIDGYSFSARLKQIPSLAQTPVILMLSRDDVFDEAKARQAGIIDNIAKPFESQELIGKVRKAISAAPRAAEPAAMPRPAAAAVSKPAPPVAPPAQKPRQATPPDIFDIIEEAPSSEDLRPGTAISAAEEEAVFEVEPELEAEEQQILEVEEALPVGKKAVEEMRAGLGLGLSDGVEPADEEPGVESLGLAAVAALDAFEQPVKRRPVETAKAPLPEAVEYVPPVRVEPAAAAPSVAVSEEMLRSMAQEAVAKMAKEVFAKLPPIQPPAVSEQMLQKVLEESVAKIVRETARQVVEKVAWEVIPDLAEMLIKAEIERLKAET